MISVTIARQLCEGPITTRILGLFRKRQEKGRGG